MRGTLVCLVRKDRQAVHILLSHSISIMDGQRRDGEALSSPQRTKLYRKGESSMSVIPLMCIGPF